MNPRDEHDIQMLIDLVSVRSVSGEEARAVEVFVGHARLLGLNASVDAAGNGIALRPAIGNETHRVVLLGHIDTVPGDSPVGVTDGVLHGRGAVDAKGPLAAFLGSAARMTLPDGVAVEVIAAVGEETPDSPGARYIRDRRSPAACIIGEPSGWDGVTLGYKGRLLVEAGCERDWSHTAGAEASAADTLHAWWSGVLGAVGSDNAVRLFDRVQATIQRSSADNDGMREIAGMTCGFRLPPGVAPEELESSVRTMTPDGIRLRFLGHTPAHVADRSNVVARALTTAIREHGGSPRPKLKTGTADFNIVGPAWGCPIAAYGPGDSALDHTPDERIELAEFVRSIGVLTGAVETIAGELVSSTPLLAE
ncbi:MAG: [LysW]-lysine hydrolase [Phycisphaeraceae bacterium]|nr:[LysW]-lysine hydrolase [Phycisphaeraceae bacterium]MCB9847490.1 [LysW]-lysine hydrolase [Phycisphaeraceae bacterium]